jgi:hypothetical protein
MTRAYRFDDRDRTNRNRARGRRPRSRMKRQLRRLLGEEWRFYVGMIVLAVPVLAFLAVAGVR